MNIILLSCTSDSLVAKACTTLCACHREIIEPCTYDADVAILAII